MHTIIFLPQFIIVGNSMAGAERWSLGCVRKMPAICAGICIDRESVLKNLNLLYRVLLNFIEADGKDAIF